MGKWPYRVMLFFALGCVAVFYQNCSKTNFAKQTKVHVPGDTGANGGKGNGDCENTIKGCDSDIDSFGSPGPIGSDDGSDQAGGPGDSSSDDDNPFNSPLPPFPNDGDRGVNIPAVVSVGEQEGVAEIEVMFNSPVSVKTVLQIEVEGTSATANEDFDAGVPSSVTLNPGEDTAVISVGITNDDLWDVTDEKLFVQISNGQNAHVTKVTIVDDEPMPGITLRDSFFNNPDTTTPNALIFSFAADERLKVSLRSDADDTEAGQNLCDTNPMEAEIAIPMINYVPVAVTEVTMEAYQVESSEFMTTWMDLPGDKPYTICFHLLDIWTE